MNIKDLIAEARGIGNWAQHETGPEGEGRTGPTLFARLVYALESTRPRIIQDRDEFMALSEHCTVRIDYVNKDGNERTWHVHRISGSGGAGAGNAELAGNWDEIWDSYRESRHTLAARFTVLYNGGETK